MRALAGGLVLALASSLALNGSFMVQGAGALAAPAVDARRPLRAVAGLLRSPLWAAGLALGVCGWGLYVAALVYAPLSLVQAFAAGGLVLVAPVAVRLLGHSLDGRERVGLALMTGALVMLALGARPPAGAIAPATLLSAYLATAGGLAVVVALRGGGRGGEALGLAAGLLYGAGDVATEALTTAWRGGGVAAIARSPLAAVLLTATACAFLCFQRGLQSGRALRVTALMTAATNVVSIVGGVLVFGDSLGATPGLTALHVAALGVVVLAGWTLAPIQARVSAAAPRTLGDDTTALGHDHGSAEASDAGSGPVADGASVALAGTA